VEEKFGVGWVGGRSVNGDALKFKGERGLFTCYRGFRGLGHSLNKF
jgi:hypothetical protein